MRLAPEMVKLVAVVVVSGKWRLCLEDGGMVTISLVVDDVDSLPVRGSITVTARLSETVFSSSSSSSSTPVSSSIEIEMAPPLTISIIAAASPFSENSEAGVEDAEDATTKKDELSLRGSATTPSTSIDSLFSAVDVDCRGELFALDKDVGEVTRSTESELQSVAVFAGAAEGGVVTVLVVTGSASKKDPAENGLQ